MFFITNRQIHPEREGLARFGDKPNQEGPNELRAVEVKGSPTDPTIEIVEDELAPAWRRKQGITDDWLRGMGFNPTMPVFGSVYVAYKVLQQVNPAAFGKKRSNGKNLLFFVHGYNNDVAAVVKRALSLEERYDVAVVAFSWPANGGGARTSLHGRVHGIASYLSDKTDARASVAALDRTLAKAADFMERSARLRRETIDAKAARRADGNSEREAALRAGIAEKSCPFTVNLALHSMGNYLFKQLIDSTASQSGSLVFDNVVLIAADVNNRDHAEWVDRIRARRRVFITINEADSALRVSRMKFGDEQLARLGHHPFRLDAKEAIYVDFTDADYVTGCHTYFEGVPLRNGAVKRFFREAFNGEFAERNLFYDTARNTHRMAADRHSARQR